MQLSFKIALCIALSMFGSVYPPSRVFAQEEAVTPTTSAVQKEPYQKNIENIRESRFGLNDLAYLLGMGGCTKTDGKVTCPPVDARKAILRLIQIALGFTSIIAFAFVAYGGFQWATAGGSEERVGKGRKTLTWAVAGTIVLVTAWSIITWVMSLISEVV